MAASTTIPPIQSETRPHRRLARTSLGLLLSCTALPAAAQDQAPTQTPAPEATDGEGKPIVLQPLIVEGQTTSGYKVDESANEKFTAPLLDTPKTVTVIPEEVIERQGATTLQDVFRTTPGITLGAGEGGTPNSDRPQIRGFNAESNIYVDGLRDTGAQTRGTFNLEQVEIVKGPGSVYAGRGSTGGTINLVTKTPKPEDFTRVSGTFGTEPSLQGTADANRIIDDGTAVRLNLIGNTFDVAGRDAVDGTQFGIAPSLAFGMDGPTRATLSFIHYQTDDIPDYGLPFDQTTNKPADVDPDNFYGLTDRDFRETQLDQATIRLEHDLTDKLTISNTTRYSWSTIDYIVTNPDDSRGNVADGLVFRSPKSRNSDTTILANQTNLLGEANDGWFRHSFLFGAEIAREESQSRNYSVDVGGSNCAVRGVGASSGFDCTSLFDPNPGDPFTGSISPSESFREVGTTSLAAYAFDTVTLTDQWQVNFGLRLDDYKTDVESGGGRGGPFSGTNESTFLNYQGGVVYKPVPFGSIYASIGTSSDPSGLSGGEGSENLSDSNVDLEPERSISYELGTKWDLFDRRLSLSGAVFRTDKTNARIDDPLGGTSDVLDGEQRVDGFELGIAGNITREWQVFGGYTFLRSEVVDDGPGTDDGNELPNVPKHSFSIFSTYDVFRDWTLGGGATYMSRRFTSTSNTRQVPDYWRFDALVEYRPTDTLTLRVNGLNITDERYFDTAHSVHFATVAPGRTVLFTVADDF